MAKKYVKLEKQLRAEQVRLRDELQSFRESAPRGVTASDEPSYGNHLADEATTTYDQEANLALERHLESQLDAISTALHRIAEGTYGSCERCGRPIGDERLEAMPTAILCINCKSREPARR